MGPASGVLEVQDAQVPGCGHHQVARHPVAMHRHHGLGQGAVDQQPADALPLGLLLGRPGDAELLADAPLRKELELLLEHPLVKGRQLACRHMCLQSHERGQRRAHQPVCPAARSRGWVVLQRLQVRCPAQVLQQQEPFRFVAAQHLRSMQLRLPYQPGDVHEGPDVRQRRWRVHDDEGAGLTVALPFNPQIAPEAGVCGGQRQRLQAQPPVPLQAGQPVLESRSALRMGPIDGAGGHGGAQLRWEVRGAGSIIRVILGRRFGHFAGRRPAGPLGGPLNFNLQSGAPPLLEPPGPGRHCRPSGVGRGLGCRPRRRAAREDRGSLDEWHGRRGGPRGG